MKKNKQFEIDWNGSGNEKYNFNSENLCWISNVGEVTVCEYGINEAIYTFWTEYT